MDQLHLSFGELVARLVAALVCGGLIGIDREARHKAAGLRTMMMVALGAAAFTLLALEVADRLDAPPGNRAEATARVIQGIVGGIGFIGAGSIIQSRGKVRGVTTAAGIWVTASLGVACGMGAYSIVGVTTVLAVVTLTVVGALEKALIKRTRREEGPAEGVLLDE